MAAVKLDQRYIPPDHAHEIKEPDAPMAVREGDRCMVRMFI